jgi:hypothetical protein
VKHDLERVVVPGSDAARERARPVVLGAFAAREPLPPARRAPFVAVAAAVAAAVVLAIVSPPGRAVVDRVREIVGVQRAQPALFSLPAPGRLLVASDPGVWVVEQNGKKRLLAGYREASWSPFGRFVVAARENELAALEPDGDVRWTLARPNIRFPRWTGSATDTRIAYVDRSGIRVVAGDGTGDRLLAPSGRGPLAWRPGPAHVLAYVSGSQIRVQHVDNGRVLRRINRGSQVPVTRLEWSSDGRRLLVATRDALHIFDGRGALVARDDPSDASRDTDAALRPRSHRVAVVRRHGTQSTVFELATGRSVFEATGALDRIAYSPDGRWLLLGWPEADQWLFVRSDGKRIQAVVDVGDQFRSRTFPRVEGWCCAE